MNSPLPASITALDALYDRALAAIDAARFAKRDLNRELQELTRYEYDDLSWDPDKRDVIEDEVKNFAGIVARLAQQQLSTQGARLQIDLWDFLETYRDQERAIRDRRRNDYDVSVEVMMAEIEAVWRVFRPSGLWRDITGRYSPAVVAESAYQRAAHQLVQTFDLAYQPEPRVLKGRVELELSFPLQRTGQGVSLHFCSGKLHEFAEAFHTFALAMFPGRSDGLAGVGHAIARREHSTFTLRERMRLAADVELVVFATTLKLYLPSEIAAALNQFVTTHAPSAFERRRFG